MRGGFVARLRQAVKDGRLERIDPAMVDAMRDRLMVKYWVVYAKRCLTHTETVIDDLGRYSHRTALSDGRLLRIDGDQIALAYKDYRDGDQRKVMTLSAVELLRRFLLYVLPKGFMRIRHFGFLANRCRTGQRRVISKLAPQARPRRFEGG